MPGPIRGLLNSIIQDGTLTVLTCDGVCAVYGQGLPHVTIRFHDRRVAWAILRDAALGTAETFMDGRLTVESFEGVEGVRAGKIADLLDLVMANLRWHPDNAVRMRASRTPRWLTRLMQLNARRSARRNVAHHYDLSDRLYDLFLDADRQYSCAYFREGVTDLEVAQHDKKAHIAAKLLLAPGQRVLDVGCGWGGMALYLNRVAGVAAHGITLSSEQLAVAQRRAADAGVADAVRFSLTDYRDLTECYDRIVSVGMFEHVGLPNYRRFFETAARLLDDHGVMLLHTIGRADGPGITDSFTRKYIFPGGYCPALSELMPHIERAGLYVTDLEVLRLHYAETLRAWEARCEVARDDIIALYDERFYRMWMFYLASARTAFEYAGHVVFQLQLARRIDAVPLTRDYMLAQERALLERA